MGGKRDGAAPPMQQHRQPQQQQVIAGARLSQGGSDHSPPRSRACGGDCPPDGQQLLFFARETRPCRRSRADRRHAGDSRCAQRRGRSRAAGGPAQVPVRPRDPSAATAPATCARKPQRLSLDAFGLREIDVVALLHAAHGAFARIFIGVAAQHVVQQALAHRAVRHAHRSRCRAARTPRRESPRRRRTTACRSSVIAFELADRGCARAR